VVKSMKNLHRPIIATPCLASRAAGDSRRGAAPDRKFGVRTSA